MANFSDSAFVHKPLPSSVLIHGQASGPHLPGLQALIVKDVEAYDATLCTESYRKLGLPCPPVRDQTIQWLKQVQPANSGFVFLQCVEKALPFISFDKTVSPNRLILTTKAYIKLLNLFSSPSRSQESEYSRLEKRFKTHLDTMRTNTQPTIIGPFLSFVSHGSSTFQLILEKYTDWNLSLMVYGESQWSRETPLQLTLKYSQSSKSANFAYTGSYIQIYPDLMAQIVSENLVNHLKKNYGTSSGYFTCPTSPPVSAPVLDILALAAQEAKIKNKTQDKAVQKVLRECGLGNLSNDSSSEEEEIPENLDSYSLPVVAAVAAAPGKIKTAGSAKGKPYDKPTPSTSKK